MALQAGQTDEFACVDVEVDRLGVRVQRQPSGAQDHVAAPSRSSAAVRQRDEAVSAGHEADQLLG